VTETIYDVLVHISVTDGAPGEYLADKITDDDGNVDWRIDTDDACQMLDGWCEDSDDVVRAWCTTQNGSEGGTFIIATYSDNEISFSFWEENGDCPGSHLLSDFYWITEVIEVEQ
jgi:hypothetical protein